MYHRPSATYFKVEGNAAWVIATAELLPARTERRLAKQAVKRFWSGELSGAKGVRIPYVAPMPPRVARAALPRISGLVM
jgi:hypothetical protein